MTVGTLTFDQIVRIQAAGVQASAADVVDFTPGSLTLALLEGNASVALWEQALLLRILALTRAASSTGLDLDTWMADYFLARLPAVAATGLVMFSRFTATLSAVLPAGTTVTTGDGTQAFQVAIDRTNPSWVESLQGYQAATGTASLTVPVVAQVAGIGGNVVSNAITLIADSLSGFTSVANPAGFTTGIDAETDDALRARFRLYIASLSRGTEAAIGFAISSTRQGLSYSTVIGVQADGTPRSGFVLVTVDDGSGSPSSTLIDQVHAAVNGYRAAGIDVAVQAPTVVGATVTMVLTTAPGTNRQAAIASVASSVTAYINALAIGAPLRFGQLYRLAYDADPGITDVSSLQLNSGTADIGGAPSQVVRTVSVVVG